MITKANLKDWLAESERKAYAKELEQFIDCEIKRNALEGKTSFYISTGEWGENYSVKTGFYPIWYTDKLSNENRKIVQDATLDKYRDFGFDVRQSTVDCGWNNHYFALLFKDIDNVLAGG